MPKVKYIANIDSNEATAAATLRGRPDLVLGGEPVSITEQEYEVLVKRIVMEIVDAKDHYNPNSADEQPAIDELDGLNLDGDGGLKDVAKQEGVDTTGLRSKADHIAAIREKRNPQPTGIESLPATATKTPTPSTSGAGGAAGPGGAAASGGSQGGGSSSSGGERP